MKKVLMAIMLIGLLATGASAKIFNFENCKDWADDKDTTHYAAVVKTAYVKNGYNYGTAEIIENSQYKGKIVKFTQKPFFVATSPFANGALIWVTPYDNPEPK